jgi:DNA mismatch endonuclease (patch repair protein)
MADVVSPEARSRMMAGIRGKNTRPELFLRKALHAKGFRFRIHTALPGKPDMVFPKWNAIIFVHGCFWHRHSCHLFKWPKSRPEFWRAKISENKARDDRNVSRLIAMGWRVGIVRECALKGRTRLDSSLAIARCSAWIRSNKKRFELSGV